MNTPLTWKEKAINIGATITTKMIKGKFYIYENYSSIYYEFENFNDLMDCLVGVEEEEDIGFRFGKEISIFNTEDKEIYDKYKIIIFDTYDIAR